MEHNMNIIYEEGSKEFHLYNDQISYIIQILPNGQLGNVYFGSRLRHKEDFSYLTKSKRCSLAVYTGDKKEDIALQYIRQEYPAYGTGDFRYPAFEIKQENGSRISKFIFDRYKIYDGKKKLPGLPATYVEEEEEAKTLEIVLKDALIGIDMILSYSIFRKYSVVARNVRFENVSGKQVKIERVMSASIDFPDNKFELMTFSGAWARERSVKVRKLEQGIQGVYSMRGASSSEHNPFIILKRPEATENSGEVYGFSLVYSGNHLELVDNDTDNLVRVMLGIHPDTIEWPLNKGEVFQSPEAVLAYSNKGLNGLSQNYHKLYRTRLARGYWRDRERPILINNWEATGPDFTEERILDLASKAKELGVELFVLDDGWFGERDDDVKGLGDWYVKNKNKLPDGIEGLSEKIEELGMKFGLWFEPEMVNKDSDLYRKHPDWILHTPGREDTPSRNQFVLDFSRDEVVNAIYDMMEKLLIDAKISYIKWDMNRYITECYSLAETAEYQGTIFHKYILGVYSLYERLIQKFPTVLFESCASGGSRFDPGMLYYAPQAWTSDNTDAIERLQIQYGTSYSYPLSSMGAHVSRCPNYQNGRRTPLSTRGNVAQFGMLGYELDLLKLPEEQLEMMKEQIQFHKKYRSLIMNGSFYRIRNPFTEHTAAWIVVAADQSKAIAAYYKIYTNVNQGFDYFKVVGLDPNARYKIDQQERTFYGDELMQIGIHMDQNEFCKIGSVSPDGHVYGDYESRIFVISRV